MFIWEQLCLPNLELDLSRKTVTSKGCLCFLIHRVLASLAPGPAVRSSVIRSHLAGSHNSNAQPETGSPRGEGDFPLCRGPSFLLQQKEFSKLSNVLPTPLLLKLANLSEPWLPYL